MTNKNNSGFVYMVLKARGYVFKMSKNSTVQRSLVHVLIID